MSDKKDAICRITGAMALTAKYEHVFVFGGFFHDFATANRTPIIITQCASLIQMNFR
jgi:hypothetical protein